MRFTFIDQQRLNHSVTLSCRALHASKAGFYGCRKRQLTRCVDTLALETSARAAHEIGRQTYGPERLRSELQEAGFHLSLSTVKRLRQRLGLRCKHIRTYKATTNSNHSLSIAASQYLRKKNSLRKYHR